MKNSHLNYFELTFPFTGSDSSLSNFTVHVITQINENRSSSEAVTQYLKKNRELNTIEIKSVIEKI
jgi:hypothetical protein